MDALRCCVLPAAGLLSMCRGQENKTSTRKTLCKVRSLRFLSIWTPPRLWNSYLSKATALLSLLAVNNPSFAPSICLDYSNPSQCPRVPSIPKLPLQYLLQAHVRAIHHSVPKEESCSPGLSRTHLSYSRVENNPLENQSLFFYQVTLPTTADSRQLLSYLWKMFFMSCTVAAAPSFLFPSLISGHHWSAGQPRSGRP